MVKCNFTETDTCKLNPALNKISKHYHFIFHFNLFIILSNKNICANDLETLLHGNFDFFLNFFVRYTLKFLKHFGNNFVDDSLEVYCREETFSCDIDNPNYLLI